MTLKIVAAYTRGTNKFWCYEHRSDEGIFKFWIPHTQRIDNPDGSKRYKPLRPPTAMDIHVEFERGNEHGR